MDLALDMLRNYPNPGSRILEAIMPTMVTYDQTVKLFDVVPGLEDFNYDQATGNKITELVIAQRNVTGLYLYFLAVFRDCLKFNY